MCETPTTLDIPTALRNHFIPIDPYSSLQGLSVSPSGQPYIPLPGDLAEFCLTNYLPPTTSDVSSNSASPSAPAAPSSGGREAQVHRDGSEQDAQDHYRLLEDPYFRKVLATFLAGKKDAGSLEQVRQGIRTALDNTNETRGWCLPVIRRTAEVLSSPTPHLIGEVAVTRFHFMPFGPEEAARRRAKQARMDPRECYWSFSCWLDPAAGGKGVVTAAVNYIITEWYYPQIHTFPGQLVSGWLASNIASRRLHEKLGFATVGKCYWLIKARKQNGQDDLGIAERAIRDELKRLGPMEEAERENEVERRLGLEKEKWRSGLSVWQGPEGTEPVSKEESVYAELEDWD